MTRAADRRSDTDRLLDCFRHQPQGSGVEDLPARSGRTIPHDDQECAALAKVEAGADVSPNLLIWTGWGHLVALAFRMETV